MNLVDCIKHNIGALDFIILVNGLHELRQSGGSTFRVNNYFAVLYDEYDPSTRLPDFHVVKLGDAVVVYANAAYHFGRTGGKEWAKKGKQLGERGKKGKSRKGYERNLSRKFSNFSNFSQFQKFKLSRIGNFTSCNFRKGETDALKFSQVAIFLK